VELDLSGLVLPQRIEVEERSEDGRFAQFVMTPLERGFGQTLGNTVRRILLSSLGGAAVWAFRLDGVVHEHQTVDGVVEDVHQIIQNLKTLVISLDEDQEEVELDFGQIESILGVELPNSARSHRAWWANSASNARAAGWMDAGWRMANADLEGERVRFERSS
jgi:hypothetical protein